jgi:hypothetical protein
LLADSSVGKGRRRPAGRDFAPAPPRGATEEDRMMKLAKRIMITLGSLAALAFAGGAHFKF